MVWTVDADNLIDRFLADERVNVLITNRPKYAVGRREQLVHDREKTRPAMSTEVTLPDGSRLKYPRCPFRPPSVTI